MQRTFAALAPDWLARFAAAHLDRQQRDELAVQGQIDFALCLASGERLPGAGKPAPAASGGALADAGGWAGVTSSGKSTTLAALFDAINRQQARHIITLEDPIEFIHQSQREIGAHCASFSFGLRAARGSRRDSARRAARRRHYPPGADRR